MNQPVDESQWIPRSVHRDTLAEIEQLRKALIATIEVAEWMSGSNDFGPEGQAWQGWLKAQPVLENARALVREPRTD